MGNIYKNNGNLAKAEISYKKSYDILKSTGNKKNMAFPLANLAGIETVKGKYNEAISYYQDYFDIQSDIGHQKRLSHGNYYLGSTLVKNGDLNNALPYLDKAIDIQTELGLKDELVESEIYRALCLKKLNEEFEMDRVIELVDSTELSYDSLIRQMLNWIKRLMNWNRNSGRNINPIQSQKP